MSGQKEIAEIKTTLKYARKDLQKSNGWQFAKENIEDAIEILGSGHSQENINTAINRLETAHKKISKSGGWRNATQKVKESINRLKSHSDKYNSKESRCNSCESVVEVTWTAEGKKCPNCHDELLA